MRLIQQMGSDASVGPRRCVMKREASSQVPFHLPVVVVFQVDMPSELHLPGHQPGTALTELL